MCQSPIRTSISFSFVASSCVRQVIARVHACLCTATDVPSRAVLLAVKGPSFGKTWSDSYLYLALAWWTISASPLSGFPQLTVGFIFSLWRNHVQGFLWRLLKPQKCLGQLSLWLSERQTGEADRAQGFIFCHCIAFQRYLLHLPCADAFVQLPQ